MTGGRVVVLGPTALVITWRQACPAASPMCWGLANRRRSTPRWWSCSSSNRGPGLAARDRRAAHFTGSTVASSVLADWPRRARSSEIMPDRLPEGAARPPGWSKGRGPRRGCGDHGGDSWLIPHGIPRGEQGRGAQAAVDERVGDWQEVYEARTPTRSAEVSRQARAVHGLRNSVRHSGTAGCPLGNLIPEWNDLVRRGAGRRPASACTPPTTSRVHRAVCVRRP